jgi:hypothetical protein
LRAVDAWELDGSRRACSRWDSSDSVRRVREGWGGAGGADDGGGAGEGVLAERMEGRWPGDGVRLFREDEAPCWRPEAEDGRGVSSDDRSVSTDGWGLYRSVDARVIEGISLTGGGLLGTCIEGIEGLDADDRSDKSDSGRMKPGTEEDDGDTGRGEEDACDAIRVFETPLGELRPTGTVRNVVGVGAPVPFPCGPVPVQFLLARCKRHA